MILDRFRLDDRVVLITGASSGLGAAFAIACAQAGADIVITGRRTAKLDVTREQVAATGRRCVAVTADVANQADCARAVRAAVDTFGRLDVLVNNAGTNDPVPASRLSAEEFHRVLDTNVTGALFMAQAAAKAMTNGGSIINVGSVLGVTTIDAPSTAYTTSKAAVLGLTLSLARQWTGRKQIRVNTLLPGWFMSELTTDHEIGFALDRIVAGRPGEAEELASALIFLASDASSYMTGAELTIDGGFRIT